MNATKTIQKVSNSSFYSAEKDTELILNKIFLSNPVCGNELKRLLMINTKDCLDKSNQNYDKIVQNTKVKELIEQGYISLAPRIELQEHEEAKGYIILTFDEFTECPTNPQYRDCLVVFDILCLTKAWQLDNLCVRPLKIAGIIDGILNKAKLTGIGELNFMSCKELILNETYSGYSLIYQAVHGNDDRLEGE